MRYFSRALIATALPNGGMNISVRLPNSDVGAEHATPEKVLKWACPSAEHWVGVLEVALLHCAADERKEHGLGEELDTDMALGGAEGAAQIMMLATPTAPTRRATAPRPRKRASKAPRASACATRANWWLRDVDLALGAAAQPSQLVLPWATEVPTVRSRPRLYLRLDDDINAFEDLGLACHLKLLWVATGRIPDARQEVLASVHGVLDLRRCRVDALQIAGKTGGPRLPRVGLGEGVGPVRHPVGTHAPGEFEQSVHLLLIRGLGRLAAVREQVLASVLGRLELGAADP
jgi:hypothetical protein